MPTPTQAATIAGLLQTAVAHHQAGRLDEAESLYRRVLAQMPAQPDALHLLGVIEHRRGNEVLALEHIRRAIDENPFVANYHLSLGNVLQSQGKREDAVASYRRALTLKPDYVDAYNNLGTVLKLQGDLEGAAESYDHALALQPGCAEAWSNLGNVRRMQGRLEESVSAHRQALQIAPEHADAYGNLGNTLQAQGHAQEAVDCYRQALRLHPDDAETLGNLGAALGTLGDADEALACCLKAIELDPECVDAFCNLGNIHLQRYELEQAIGSYRRALELNPGNAEMWSNLGNAQKDKGELTEAEASYRKALELDADCANANNNLIFTLDLMTGRSTADLQTVRRTWSERRFGKIPAPARHDNPRDPKRKLKIGYISADFRQHSASVVFGALLTGYDRASHEVHAYSNGIQEDANTERFRKSVSGWTNIVGLNDEALAEKIRQDRIDILVDLSGYSAGNRLAVFARKPAPIQITAWGYIGGTGMPAMDIFLADPVVVPPEEKQAYAEEVRYLPNAVSAWFPEAFPDVSMLPAARAGRQCLKFGSLNRICKITEETCRTWSRVLKAQPDSRLLLKSGELDDEATRKRLLERMEREGIEAERIELRGRSSWREHMETFNEIDIALDPYPHGGGVTTLEGLMMGVPVVTLRWPTLPGRVSASILTTLELTDWIAEDEDQYIEIAQKKAQDLEGLAELRRTLRGRFQDSIIGDTKRYVQAVEAEYRKLWEAWCEQQDATATEGQSRK